MTLYHTPILTSIGKRVAGRPEAERAAGGIEQVPEQDVLDVLLADGPGAQHGEADLHEEDEGAGEDEVEGVDAGDEAGARLGTTSMDGDGFSGRCMSCKSQLAAASLTASVESDTHCRRAVTSSAPWLATQLSKMVCSDMMDDEAAEAN